MHLRIEQEKNGRKQVYERTYDGNALRDQVNRSFSGSFPDSLEKEWSNLPLDSAWSKAFDPHTRFSFDWSTDSLPNQKHSFRFNRSDADSLLSNLRGVFKHFDADNDFAYSFQMPDERAFSFRVHPFPPDFSLPFPGKDRFEFNEEDYALKEQRTDRGRKYIITRKTTPRHRPESADKHTSSVKNLQVTAGTAGLVDVDFYLPTKGDAEIRVTDIQGKEVFKEKLKVAEGRYSRQLNLGKKPSGTYFVTVTQHQDGQVQRVKIP